MLVATPSGITLAPEGGAHQSIGEPLIGLAQPGLVSLRAGLCRRAGGAAALGLRGDPARKTANSVYFRLSTRPVEQPARTIAADLDEAIIAGAYWLHEPADGAELAIAYCGAVAPKRWPPTRSWPKTSPRRACWRSPRPTACTATGGRPAPRRDQRRRAAVGSAAPGRRAGHRRRFAPGDPVVARRGCRQHASCRWGSTASANPATSRTSTSLHIDTGAILDAAARACLLALRSTCNRIVCIADYWLLHLQQICSTLF